MNLNKIITPAIVALLTWLLMWWWCHRHRPCPPCPVATNCDTCYCPNPGQVEKDSTWCCTDRLTKPCTNKYDELCINARENDFINADIRIDLLGVTTTSTQVITDIKISNNGDDDAACAKLEVLMPAATTFINLVKIDGFTANWEYYRGYLRINLGQLSTLSSGNPNAYRHVRVITKKPCLKTHRIGIGAFVYSALPDLCLNNNYAYKYYLNEDDKACSVPEVPPVMEKQ